MTCINYEDDSPMQSKGSDLLTTYHATLLEAQRVEALHPEGSKEENRLIEVLDDLWYAMSEEQQLEARALCREVGYTDEE